MPRFAFVIATVIALLAAPALARAEVVVTVDKSAQSLTVVVDGVARYHWPVSTGRWGYRTPNGSYRPQWLARKWFSRKYDMSPMPYSIFFNGGYAIHGSYEISRLGRPASHGCIRLHPQNAAVLFSLVQANRRNTRIIVTGEAPSPMAGRVRVQRAERIDRVERVEREWQPRWRPQRARSFEEIFDDDDGYIPRGRWENMR